MTKKPEDEKAEKGEKVCDAFLALVFEYLRDNLTVNVSAREREYSDGSGYYSNVTISIGLKNPVTGESVVISEVTETV